MAISQDKAPVLSPTEPMGRLKQAWQGFGASIAEITHFNRLSPRKQAIARRVGMAVDFVAEDVMHYGTFVATSFAVTEGLGITNPLVGVAAPSIVTGLETYAHTRIATDGFVPPVERQADRKKRARSYLGEVALHPISWFTSVPTSTRLHDSVTGNSDMNMRKRMALSFTGASLVLYNGLVSLDNQALAWAGLGVTAATLGGADILLRRRLDNGSAPIQVPQADPLQ